MPPRGGAPSWLDYVTRWFAALEVQLLNGFEPLSGNSFVILDWGSIVGTFTTLSLPPLSGSLTWNTSQLYNTVVLSVDGAGITGDYNNNGIVDAADYTVWRDHLGQSFSLTNENRAAATPGLVDAEDSAFWKARFGQTGGSGSGASAVPEPATHVLLMIAMTVWNLRRGRAK